MLLYALFHGLQLIAIGGWKKKSRGLKRFCKFIRRYFSLNNSVIIKLWSFSFLNEPFIFFQISGTCGQGLSGALILWGAAGWKQHLFCNYHFHWNSSEHSRNAFKHLIICIKSWRDSQWLMVVPKCWKRVSSFENFFLNIPVHLTFPKPSEFAVLPVHNTGWCWLLLLCKYWWWTSEKIRWRLLLSTSHHKTFPMEISQAFLYKTEPLQHSPGWTDNPLPAA